MPPATSVPEIIDRAYSVALSPQEFGNFVVAWDRYMGEAVEAGDDLEGDDVIDHFERALLILERVRYAQQERQSPQSAVDRQALPSSVVAKDGRVLATNKAGAGLYGHVARFWDITDDTAAQRQLAQAVRDLATVVETRTALVSVPMRDGGRTVLFSLRRLPIPHEDDEPIVLARAATTAWSDRVAALLDQNFGLTAAELDVVRMMAEGKSVADMADERGRSAETVKSQAKSIYTRLGVEGRLEVVRLVTNLLFLTEGDPDNRPSARLPDQGEERSLVLPDGRRLTYVLKGDEDGTPFLFLHGMVIGHPFRRVLIEGFREAGLAAVCVDRPGYGRSDAPSNWRTGVESFARGDVPALLNELKIERAPLVSHTSGAVVACAAAALQPERISGVLATSAGVPMTDPDMFREYPLQVRALALSARYAPRALRFFISSAAALFRSDGEATVIRRSYEDSPVDDAALDDPEIFRLVRDGHDAIRESGYEGFCGDALQIWSDWSHYIAQAKCPIHYLQGDRDPICRVDWAANLAERFEHVHIHAMPGAGQLMQHTHWRLYLDAIAQFVFTGEIGALGSNRFDWPERSSNGMSRRLPA